MSVYGAGTLPGLRAAALAVTQISPGLSPGLALRRTPFLLAAIALMAVFFASGPHHAAAQSGGTFTVSDITVVEGGSADITVTLSAAAPTGGVELSAAASYDTPAAGKAAAADVQSVASALTIAQGQTTGTFAVAAAKDTSEEGAETFSVTVTASTTGWSPASTGDNVSTVTIHDPVRFGPQPGDPANYRSAIGYAPISNRIQLYLEVGATISIQFPAAVVGTGDGDYTYALGGPERFYKRAVGRTMPGGLTFDAATRILSGSPTGLDANGVTTLGSNRRMDYHVWDGSGEGGPDGDDNTEDNHDELTVILTICPAGSAAEADGATACKYTAGLHSLDVSHGDPATPVTLSPAFTTDAVTYTATVADSVTAVDLAVIPEHLNYDDIEMTVNGTAGSLDFTSGHSSGRLHTGTADLDAGINTITVKVTSGNSPAHDLDEEDDPIPVIETYTLTVSRGTTPSVTFDPTSIANQTYIVGIPVAQAFSAEEHEALPRLPEATLSNPPANIVNYKWSYSATGTPAGLTVGHDRVIFGTPTTVTTSAATVTYTAAITVQVDPNGDGTFDDLTTSTYTGSLTFEVTVNANPPVVFSEEATRLINSGIIWWDNANTTWVEKNLLDNNGLVTFPEAQGGTGTITYSLIDNNSGEPLAEVREDKNDMNSALTGITFDAATRKLGGTPAAWAQKPWPVQFRAEDENGNRAALVTTIYAAGKPGGL